MNTTDASVHRTCRRCGKPETVFALLETPGGTTLCLVCWIDPDLDFHELDQKLTHALLKEGDA